MGRMQLSPAAFHAYDVLFGAGASVPELSRDRLLAAARTAFKRRALATHPDRAQLLGRPVAELTAEFVRVRAAYGDLVAALEHAPTNPPAYARAASADRPAAARPAARTAQTAHTPPDVARVPARSLRFAEYRFHRGVISWRALGGAIAWQRAQRPRVGELAVWFGYLSEAQVDALLAARVASRRTHVPWCEFACERGLLSRLQAATLVGHQRRRQRPIGAFFVERAMVDECELDELLDAHAAHQRTHVR
jgi:hypothetical protein